MIRRFLRSKLFFLFLSLLIIGFFIGYDYSIITSADLQKANENSAGYVEEPAAAMQSGTSDTEGLQDYSNENINP